MQPPFLFIGAKVSQQKSKPERAHQNDSNDNPQCNGVSHGSFPLLGLNGYPGMSQSQENLN